VLHSSFMVFKFALWVTEINLELDWLGPSDWCTGGDIHNVMIHDTWCRSTRIHHWCPFGHEEVQCCIESNRKVYHMF
jgi:hypothetical protein